MFCNTKYIVDFTLEESPLDNIINNSCSLDNEAPAVHIAGMLHSRWRLRNRMIETKKITRYSH